MLTGDQNMIELNATVHYDLRHPEEFLFRQMDGEKTVRAAAESTIQLIATTTPLDQILTTGRHAVELIATKDLQRRLDKYDSGIRVLSFRLQDVHPSVEVVDGQRSARAERTLPSSSWSSSTRTGHQTSHSARLFPIGGFEVDI